MRPDSWDRSAPRHSSAPRERASQKVRPKAGARREAEGRILSDFDPIYDNVHDFAQAQRQREIDLCQAARREAEERTQFDESVQANDSRRAAQLGRYEQKRRKVEARRERAAARHAQCPACHWGLFVLTTLLALLSIPVVYSASTPVALADGHAANFYFLRQVVFVAFGYGAFLAVSRLNGDKMRYLVWGLYAVALLGLFAIDFTPLGFTQSGVRRWIKLPMLPPQQFSELAKIALIGVMADYWSRAMSPKQPAKFPWIVTAMLTLPLVALVFVQPHLSAALVLFSLPIVIATYAGAPGKHIAKVVVPLMLLAIVVIGLCKIHAMPLLKPYQQDRIAAHLGGTSDEQGSNYQKLQSERTLMSGGVFGRGPAESLGKQGHLPEPHTDFIFSVIGEEYGLVGALALLGMYGAMIFFCFHIGHCAETDFESLLCAGVGTLLAIQVSCNVGVATGVLPVTGMPLPFMSYGGSGLLCMLVGIGMVLGVSRQTTRNAQRDEGARQLEEAEVLRVAKVPQAGRRSVTA